MIRRVFVDGKPYLLDDIDGTMLPPVMGGQQGPPVPPDYVPPPGSQTPAGGNYGGTPKYPLSLQPLGGGVGILVDANGIPVVGDDGMPILRNMETGGAGSAPAYSGTQAAQSAAFAHDQNMARLQAELADANAQNDWVRSRDLQKEILALQQGFEEEQANLNREFQAEQNRLGEEAMLKRERLGVLQNLVEGFLQSQQRASEFVLQMQPNPFRFAAAAQGMPVMGTTPQEGYTEALTEYAQRPAPSMDPNAPLSAIEGGIESIMGQRFPLQPDIFGRGMASGGTVPMGASGTFLVGEKGPEVMDVSPTGVTVRPLSGGFAYGGGVDFDVSSIYAGLAPLYASLGLESAPQMRWNPVSGAWNVPQVGTESGPRGGLNILQRLGIEPNLVRRPGSRTVWYKEGDKLRPITNIRDFQEMGFRPEDVIEISQRQFQGYGPLGERLTQAPSPFGRPIGPMTNMPFPAIEPTTGAPLPAPWKIAAERRRQAAVNPQLYDIGTAAYDFPNSPIMPGALRTAEDIFTPRGSYRAPIGLR